MKKLKGDYQKDCVDTNFKFSKEWANDEEEAKRLKEEYLEQVESTQSTWFCEPIEKRPKEPEINLINKSVINKEEQKPPHVSEHRNRNLQKQLEKAKKQKIAAMIVAVFCIILIILILTSGANKREELEVDSTELSQALLPKQ